METLILIVHSVAIVFLIILVLLQQGKGSTAGAGFGGGASSTMFGSQGSFSFLMKLTYIFAFTFFLTSLMLSYFGYQKSKSHQKFLAPEQTQTIPISENPLQKPTEKKSQK